MNTLAPVRPTRASIDFFGPRTVAESDSTYSKALYHSKVANPFVAGESVIIPKGTVIHTTQTSARTKVAGRAYAITVQSEFYGHVDLDERRGLAILPTITWSGAGSYWHTAQVTPELAAANGRTLADFAMTEEQAEALRLPVLPTWEAGYTDAWTA